MKRSALIFLGCCSMWATVHAQTRSARELIQLLGKSPMEVHLDEYLGPDIDTLRSASWRYSAKTKGIMVQAHIDQYDPENILITTVTLYFSKNGYATFSSVLPFGLRPKKSWNKNRSILYHKAGFKDLEMVTSLDLGVQLQFKGKINSHTVYISALYLNDEKGEVQKEMYSLQFSILKWDE